MEVLLINGINLCEASQSKATNTISFTRTLFQMTDIYRQLFDWSPLKAGKEEQPYGTHSCFNVLLIPESSKVLQEEDTTAHKPSKI